MHQATLVMICVRSLWVFLFGVFVNTICLTTAFGCSISITDRSDEFDYDPLSKKWNIDSVINQAAGVYLARAKLLPLEGVILGGDLKNLHLARIVFSPEETLKGPQIVAIEYVTQPTRWGLSDILKATLDLSKTTNEDQKQVYDKFVIETKKAAQSHDDFAFWDHNLLFQSNIPLLSSKSSCGPPFIPTVSDGQLYLVIASAYDGEITYEPVKIEDALVRQIKAFIEGKSERIAKQITAEQYFNSMKYAAPFTINGCHKTLAAQNDQPGRWDPFTEFPLNKARWIKKEVEGDNFIEGIDIVSHGQSNQKQDALLQWIKDDWPALFEYYNNKTHLKCEVGEQFLMFGYQTRYQQDTTYTDHATAHYQYDRLSPMRFARIKNDQIILSSIRTRYDLQGPKHIPLKDVLSWISSSDFNPMALPNHD